MREVRKSMKAVTAIRTSPCKGLRCQAAAAQCSRTPDAPGFLLRSAESSASNATRSGQSFCFRWREDVCM